MTEVQIRRAVEDDIPALARIICDWEAETEWMPVAYDLRDTEAFISDVLPNREIWVAGDPIEGYLSFDPKELRVGMFYCGSRGRGLGKALMDRVKEGRDFVWLTTHEPNLSAQKFYRREGFKEVSRHAAEPPNTVPEVRMEWQG